MFPVAFIPAKKMICPAPRDIQNTPSNLRERFTNISGKIILKRRRMNETKATTQKNMAKKIS